MRTADERIIAVRSRSRRLRRRGGRALAALVVSAALLFVGITGKYATGDAMVAGASGGGLFGAASLLGASAGGYVLVAIVTAVVVALVTAMCIAWRSKREDTEIVQHEDLSNRGGTEAQHKDVRVKRHEEAK